jgi:hypothetical protein
MNKQEVENKIAQIPLFELRNVAVGGRQREDNNEWKEDPDYRAVCVVGTQKAIHIPSDEYGLSQINENFARTLGKIGEIKDGHVHYYNGYGIMTLFPDGDSFKDSDVDVGIAVHDSVNGCSAINIKIVMRSINDKVSLTLPKKMANFRRNHVGNVNKASGDYLNLALVLKQEWKTIITKFNEKIISQEEFKPFCEGLGLGDKITKKLEYQKYNNVSMWKLIVQAFNMLSSNKYTSEVHKQQRLDELSDAIFTYALVMKMT